ncbi:hypothetical protein Tco_0814854 [Tanacetum coccineum]
MQGIQVLSNSAIWCYGSQDMALPLRNERHEWLRFDTQGYTEEEQLDFETRLDKLYYRKVHRVQTLDFDGLIEDLDMDMTERLSMQHKNVDGEVVFTTFVWRELLGICGLLVREIILEFFSMFQFRKGVLDLDIDDTFQFQLGGLRR